ncbi:hypothetical protein AK812_SmicGene10333 [Symbiodinium microadriaticum]|uniref:Tyrosine-protein kinase ephrin type A/B receptor-like domain-containing protein n=1 Tax=Symbiodinium microadriaticum TaxID=2951 RepID=A0A1Q9EG32_SYMMI|nr:hypothetical protein AK812_SmicGene10333 [Symbiodinium microadriaticum]
MSTLYKPFWDHVSGSFLWFGRCWPCPRGTLCPGSNQLDLRPGYFSSPEEPAEVYICEENVCPGGPPGSCAENRDVESVACSMCLSGYHPRRDGSCHMCHNSDYLLLLSVLFLAFLGVAALYISLLKEAKAKQSRHVLVVVFGLSQSLGITLSFVRVEIRMETSEIKEGSATIDMSSWESLKQVLASQGPGGILAGQRNELGVEVPGEACSATDEPLYLTGRPADRDISSRGPAAAGGTCCGCYVFIGDAETGGRGSGL